MGSKSRRKSSALKKCKSHRECAESEPRSFPRLSLLPFPMRKEPGKEITSDYMQKEEKDWRLKRKMGAIGKVPSVFFSSAKKTVRKRFFGDRFYAVK